jgi:hypothetical protein
VYVFQFPLSTRKMASSIKTIPFRPPCTKNHPWRTYRKILDSSSQLISKIRIFFSFSSQTHMPFQSGLAVIWVENWHNTTGRTGQESEKKGNIINFIVSASLRLRQSKWHTYTRTHVRTHARTHTHTHSCTRTRTRTHTHTWTLTEI